MRQDHHRHILLLQPILLLFLMFCMGKMAAAQQFTIDTAITAPGNHTDTIPEITVYRKRMNPDKKVIIYSTFRRNSLFHNSGLPVSTAPLQKDGTYMFYLCVPINNEKGLAVQIDSVYIKGSNMPPEKILPLFTLYHNHKRCKTQTAIEFRRQKRFNVFVFEKGFRLPKGKSYLSFSYRLSDTSFKFTVKTNTRIRGALYSYNMERDEFKLIDSVQSSYSDKPKHHWMEATENMPVFSSPQVKIFCSLVPQE